MSTPANPNRTKLPVFPLDAIPVPEDVEVDAALEGIEHASEDRPSHQKLLSLGVLWPAEVDRICNSESTAQFLIDGMLRTRSVNLIAGDSTIGKSPFVCQLALCVASGVDFHGMLTRQGRVLYLDLENPLQDHKTMRDALGRHLHLEQIPGDFLVQQDPSNLETLTGEIKPSLVVIDSLRSFNPKADQDNTRAGDFLKELRRMSRAYNCVFLLVHHVKKPNGLGLKPKKLDGEECTIREWSEAVEGPRAFVNQTDTRIAVEAGDGDKVALYIKWNLRLRGDSPLLELERVLDDGEPIGYRRLSGWERLNEQQLERFNKLPREFTFKQAKDTLNLSDDPVNKLLVLYIHHKMLVKPSKGHYRKTIE